MRGCFGGLIFLCVCFFVERMFSFFVFYGIIVL